MIAILTLPRDPAILGIDAIPNHPQIRLRSRTKVASPAMRRALGDQGLRYHCASLLDDSAQDGRLVLQLYANHVHTRGQSRYVDLVTKATIWNPDGLDPMNAST